MRCLFTCLPSGVKALVFAVLATLAQAALAQASSRTAPAAGRGPALPAVPLLVELRLADERQVGGAQAGWRVGTRDLAAPPLEPVALQVLNGQGGQLRLGQQAWLQWTATAGRTVPAGRTPGAAGDPRGGAGGFVQTEAWRVDTGQELQLLQVAWPGGEAPVRVELRWEATSADSAALASGRPPPLSSQRLVTTLQAPLNEWVTLARSGGAPESDARGGWTVSTRDAAQAPRRWLQLRVSQP